MRSELIAAYESMRDGIAAMEGMLPEAVDDQIVRPRFKILNVQELLAAKTAPREMVLDPIIRSQDTAMIVAWRGIGKTWLGLDLGYSIAAGTACMGGRWRAQQPRKVLYIDGELPLQTLQERMVALIAGLDVEPPDSSYFGFLTHDAQDRGLPDLATRDGQEEFRTLVEPYQIIVFDSLSTLARGAKENDAEGWSPIQEFLLGLRHAGKTPVLLHHEGKAGTQRGTSKREDILDTVLHLKRPSDYAPSQGARFEMHFKKCRALHGQAVESFEAQLDVIAGRAVWTTRDMSTMTSARAMELFTLGMTAREVAEELNISRAHAYRLKKESHQSHVSRTSR